MKDAKDALDSSLTTSGDTNLITEEEDPGCGADDYLEPTPLATQDAAYASDAEDDTHDIGIRVGRMRLNERVGGLYRPRIADEVCNKNDIKLQFQNLNIHAASCRTLCSISKSERTITPLSQSSHPLLLLGHQAII